LHGISQQLNILDKNKKRIGREAYRFYTPIKLKNRIDFLREG